NSSPCCNSVWLVLHVTESGEERAWAKSEPAVAARTIGTMASVFKVFCFILTLSITRRELNTNNLSGFTGQFCPGTRVKHVIIHGLHANDGCDAQHVVSVGAARDISRRPVQAQQDLAVGIGAGDVADQAAGNVAGVEVGEDQYIGGARDFALSLFAHRD